MTSSATYRRSGFSLVEISVGLIATSILMAGMTGSLFLATQANRTDLGAFRHSNAGCAALDEMTRELSYSTAIRSVVPSRRIEFEVRDRTNDGVNDVILYEWNGDAGSSLRRVFNGGPATSVISGLQDFYLTPIYVNRTVPEVGSVTLKSGEMAWWSLSNANDENAFSIAAGEGTGTDHLPTFPEGAISWTVSRVELKCNRSGASADGVVKLRIWSADSNRKPGVKLAEQTVNETSLPSTASWVSFDISPVGTLFPTQRCCVTVQYAGGTGTAMQVRYENLPSLGSMASTWKLTTSNGGNSWSQEWDDKLLIRFYGTYDYPGEGLVDVVKTELQEVVIEAQGGTSADSRTRTSARVRNRVNIEP